MPPRDERGGPGRLGMREGGLAGMREGGLGMREGGLAA